MTSGKELFLRFLLTTERCVVPVTPGHEVIVRRSDNPHEVVLTDTSVSRALAGIARFELEGDTLVIAPVPSSNRTTPILLNGVKVTESTPVRGGDRIRIGYTVIVVQSLDRGVEDVATEINTVSLQTTYVRQRDDKLGGEEDRLAQWSDGFDLMKSAKTVEQVAQVILQQLVRLMPGDRVLIALGTGGGSEIACRELAACGLTSGEVERLLRWFNESRPDAGVHTPTLNESIGTNSQLRVAAGRLDVEDERWLFYLEPSHRSATTHAAHRAMSMLSSMLELYHTLQERQTRTRILAELSRTVHVFSKVSDEVDLSVIESRFVFRSTRMRAICKTLACAAAAPSPVLLMGEAGTGKQVAAQAIHAASGRRHREMVTVSLAEHPESLMESALFGHTKGAFTGAGNRVGLIAHANESTLFLDEIGEVPRSIQAKLLRVLQDGEFRRLGENCLTRVDVRVITATNRILIEEVRAGNFRQDLYDRINVIPIVIPPLRDRKEDIDLLATHFLAECNESMGKEVKIGEEGLRHLQRYTWPDNVRGLKNYIERTVALSGFGSCVLGPDEMPPFDPLPPAAASPIEDLMRTLREHGRLNQSRILAAFVSHQERRTKQAWADEVGVSRPVFRNELQKLVAFCLDNGVPLSFFESRMVLRPEDWKRISELREQNESAS